MNSLIKRLSNWTSFFKRLKYVLSTREAVYTQNTNQLIIRGHLKKMQAIIIKKSGVVIVIQISH